MQLTSEFRREKNYGSRLFNYENLYSPENGRNNNEFKKQYK